MTYLVFSGDRPQSINHRISSFCVSHLALSDAIRGDTHGILFSCAACIPWPSITNTSTICFVVVLSFCMVIYQAVNITSSSTETKYKKIGFGDVNRGVTSRSELEVNNNI